MEVSDTLFPLPAPSEHPLNQGFKNLEQPLWTQNKAHLIQRYLRYFVYVTHHGTYIDGFAGPQRVGFDDGWAAKLVLESRPRWLRNFHLCDNDANQIAKLHAMISSQPTRQRGEPKRKTWIHEGDFNRIVDTLFDEHPVNENEATFCLLDQRTFECKWSSVERIARAKPRGNKIEIFYFLPHGWLERAVSGLRAPEKELVAWWGQNWEALLSKKGFERGQLGAARFRDELNYRYAASYPILKSPTERRVMFWMIHASDHDEAMALMVRAYNNAIAPLETHQQLEMEFSPFYK